MLSMPGTGKLETRSVGGGILEVNVIEGLLHCMVFYTDLILPDCFLQLLSFQGQPCLSKKLLLLGNAILLFLRHCLC